MYLKIRDTQKGSWNYVGNLIKIEAQDILSFGKDSENGMALLEQKLAYINPDLVVLAEDVPDPLRIMILTCSIVAPGSPDIEYIVAFNTFAYLCTDTGDTMDRFIINKSHDHLDKRNDAR